MAAAKNLCAVALTFSDEIEKVFSKLRGDYQQYMNYTFVPHITLYLFMPVVDINVINEKLGEIAKKTKPFILVLDGIEYFEGENNMAFVAIKNKTQVKELHVAIFQSLKGIVEDVWNYNLNRFTPHMTIGERIPQEVFPSVMNKFSNYKLNYECRITDFNLFTEENGVWEQMRAFELQARE
jgi:2'-5' RNA ligase